MDGIWTPGDQWDYFLTECVFAYSLVGISYLLDHKPDNITDYGAEAVQHAVLYHNDLMLVKFLIERGCKVGVLLEATSWKSMMLLLLNLSNISLHTVLMLTAIMMLFLESRLASIKLN